MNHKFPTGTKIDPEDGSSCLPLPEADPGLGRAGHAVRPLKRPGRRGLGGLGSALTLGMGLGFGLGVHETAQAQAQVRVQGAGQDGFQFVPIETLAVEQLGNGAIRVSTLAGVQVLEAGQWLFANGQVMALQPVLLQNAGVTEAWAVQAPALAATTVPVLVQLPTAPAAAASITSAASLAPAAPV
ncbi:MAG: hypothetical protein VX077_01730, partial [Pseudomonadota bacterium]|nr:hypothetical protein [Pseudomonadota bacterium]